MYVSIEIFYRKKHNSKVLIDQNRAVRFYILVVVATF